MALFAGVGLLCAEPVATTSANWKSGTKQSFDFEGYKAFVVVPQQAAPGNPWVWRTSFPDYHAEVDEVLVKDGFHIAHVDVVSMLGADGSLEIMGRFRKLVRGQWGLAEKAALEGVSRGGLHAYRYASTRPDHVACVYADVPVMDLKSWPLKSDKAKKQVTDALKFYGFADEAALIAYQGNPIDILEPIAKAKIPLRHVISPNDTVVPAEDNTLEAKRRIEKLGWTIDVLVADPSTTKNEGHHFPLIGIPESVAFIKRHAGAVQAK